MSAVVWETNFPGLTLVSRGKVRDLYEVDGDLLLVATDRLSAFDVVLPTPIPDKGRVLTQLSLFWFDTLRDVVPNHVLSATEFPGVAAQFRDQLAGRSMLCRKTQPLSIECVVQGISGWLRMEGLPDHWEGLWHPATGWPARIRTVARSYFYAIYKSDGRPRREHFF